MPRQVSPQVLVLANHMPDVRCQLKKARGCHVFPILCSRTAPNAVSDALLVSAVGVLGTL